MNIDPTGLSTEYNGGMNFNLNLGMYLPALPQPMVDFSAGFGDTLSFGLTRGLREISGIGSVNYNSRSYTVGDYSGVGLSLAMGGVGGWKAAGTKIRNDGLEFSHWVPTRFVSGKKVEDRIPVLENNFGKWLVAKGNKWNGNYVSKENHALSDPSRYQFMPRTFKQVNPMMPNKMYQQYIRVPNVYKGATFGAGYGVGGSYATGAYE